MICRGLVGLCLLTFTLSAGAVLPYQEYRKHMETAQNLSVLKNGLFGDSVSLYNGSTTFAVTDIDLPGNNTLPVQLSRQFSVQIQPQSNLSSYDSRLGGAANWDVDVPYIAGTFIGLDWDPQRCSVNMGPKMTNAKFFTQKEIWQGNLVHIPGGTDRIMLGLIGQTPFPSDGRTYRYTTRERDMFDCIPMQSGSVLSGEGFRMRTSDGLLFYFDTATYRSAGALVHPLGDLGGEAHVLRNRIYLLATKIEDRFGNAVNFQYNAAGHVQRIWANDGREIVMTYSNGRLIAAGSGGRTWSYEYQTGSTASYLTSVKQPDNAEWKYSYAGDLQPWVDTDTGLPSTPNCSSSVAIGADFTITATHPSGAIGMFEFGNLRHRRSGVHISSCNRRPIPATHNWSELAMQPTNWPGSGGINDPLRDMYGTEPDWNGSFPETSPLYPTEAEHFDAQDEWYMHLDTPHYFDVVSLLKKHISGPGIEQTLTWSYDYSLALPLLWGSHFEPFTYPCMTCTSEKTVTVTNPDASKTRHRFGILYWLNDGMHLGTETVGADGVIYRKESTVYMDPETAANQLFNLRYGSVYTGVDPSTIWIRPVVKQTIEQDGMVFTTTMSNFDSFARPLNVVKASALSP